MAAGRQVITDRGMWCLECHNAPTWPLGGDDSSNCRLGSVAATHPSRISGSTPGRPYLFSSYIGVTWKVGTVPIGTLPLVGPLFSPRYHGPTIILSGWFFMVPPSDMITLVFQLLDSQSPMLVCRMYLGPREITAVLR